MTGSAPAVLDVAWPCWKLKQGEGSGERVGAGFRQAGGLGGFLKTAILFERCPFFGPQNWTDFETDFGPILRPIFDRFA